MNDKRKAEARQIQEAGIRGNDMDRIMAAIALGEALDEIDRLELENAKLQEQVLSTGGGEKP